MVNLKSMSLYGLQVMEIEVEVATHPGEGRFSVVGLGDAAIQESRERVRAAIKSAGFRFHGGRTAINLAPADLKKQGPKFDLAMAVGILYSMGQFSTELDLDKVVFLGELGFQGQLRGVSGVLPIVSFAQKMGYRKLFLPKANADEARLIAGIDIYAVENLLEVVDHLSGQELLSPLKHRSIQVSTETEKHPVDFAHIKGNQHAKRALEIAAAGGHNLLMCGPPGSGKTMLAQSIQSILPTLAAQEALELTQIYSVSGQIKTNHDLVLSRPFRSIHHTASSIAIIGGGNPPKPGEISLSHRGILFLDEFPEFPQKTLEALRQPLEDGVVTISRASGSCTFPAKFMLISAMNPTPSGYEVGHPKCVSSPFEIQRYQNKISGPMLDRIDLHLSVPRVALEKISSLPEGEPSVVVRKRVEVARLKQYVRFKGTNLSCNADMRSVDLKTFAKLTEAAEKLIQQASAQFELSGRSYFRLIKVARTIADLEESDVIDTKHMAEALQYRSQAD